MTLAVILAPLLALCVVARGIGFLPVLGVVTAVAMLVDHQAPLQEFGAACVVVFSVLPVWFVSRYQDDGARERSGPAVPFLALGLMVILQLATGTPAATWDVPGHAGAAYLPAGLCVALAGLVAVTCRHSMVWQWAGLLVCVDGIMLSGVIENQIMVVGVTALAGCVVALLGGLCVHRVMLRVAVAPAQNGAGADRPAARSTGFELGDVEPTGPEPRRLGPEAVVVPRIWSEADVAAEAEDDSAAQSRVEHPDTETGLATDQASGDATEAGEKVAQQDSVAPNAEAASDEGTEPSDEAPKPETQGESDASIKQAERTETESVAAEAATDSHQPNAETSEDDADAQVHDADAPEPLEPDEDETGQRSPEIIARDVWLKGYLAERGRDA